MKERENTTIAIKKHIKNLLPDEKISENLEELIIKTYGNFDFLISSSFEDYLDGLRKMYIRNANNAYDHQVIQILSENAHLSKPFTDINSISIKMIRNSGKSLIAMILASYLVKYGNVLIVSNNFDSAVNLSEKTFYFLNECNAKFGSLSKNRIEIVLENGYIVNRIDFTSEKSDISTIGKSYTTIIYDDCCNKEQHKFEILLNSTKDKRSIYISTLNSVRDPNQKKHEIISDSNGENGYLKIEYDIFDAIENIPGLKYHLRQAILSNKISIEDFYSTKIMNIEV